MTDHITLPRSVVEQAIEALDGVHEGEHHGGVEESAEALRTALAGAAQAEPVAWRYLPSKVWGSYVITTDPHVLESAKEYGCEPEPLYTAPQPAQPVAVPHGWKLVPVEPTPEMRSAACAAIRWYEQEATARAVYAAMLNAAPTPPTKETP